MNIRKHLAKVSERNYITGDVLCQYGISGILLVVLLYASSYNLMLRNKFLDVFFFCQFNRDIRVKKNKRNHNRVAFS